MIVNMGESIAYGTFVGNKINPIFMEWMLSVMVKTPCLKGLILRIDSRYIRNVLSIIIYTFQILYLFKSEL